VQALFPLAVGKLAYVALLVPGGVFADAMTPLAPDMTLMTPVSRCTRLVGSRNRRLRG